MLHLHCPNLAFRLLRGEGARVEPHDFPVRGTAAAGNVGLVQYNRYNYTKHNGHAGCKPSPDWAAGQILRWLTLRWAVSVDATTLSAGLGVRGAGCGIGGEGGLHCDLDASSMVAERTVELRHDRFSDLLHHLLRRLALPHLACGGVVFSAPKQVTSLAVLRAGARAPSAGWCKKGAAFPPASLPLFRSCFKLSEPSRALPSSRRRLLLPKFRPGGWSKLCFEAEIPEVNLSAIFGVLQL